MYIVRRSLPSLNFVQHIDRHHGLFDVHFFHTPSSMRIMLEAQKAVSDTPLVNEENLTDRKSYKTGIILFRPFTCPKINSFNLLRCSNRRLHTSGGGVRGFLDTRDKDHHAKEKELVIHQGQYFDEAAKKARDKKTFQEAVALYIKRNHVHRRGHVEFIYAALSRMIEFNVHRDLDSYKRILDLFPKHKMVPTSVWQVEFQHYPKQQQCCIDIMEHMEANGVIPDDAMGYQLIEIFGQQGHAFRKYQRMMYWMPKFRFANPYYVPHELPSDDTELARLALQRMCVDLENKISTFMTKDLESSNDHTTIVSGQSPVQSALIAELPRDKPIFVEGGHTVWMRKRSLTYFILRADCSDRYKRFQTQPKATDEDMFQWLIFEEECPKILSVPPSAHEQDDGTVLAMCITGTSSKDSLASWIKFLERNNPALSEIPVVFLLRSPATEILTSEDAKKGRTKSSELMN